MRFSRKTLAALARVLPRLGHSDLTVSFFEYSVGDFDGSGNLVDRSLGLVRGIEYKENEGYDSDKAIVEIIEKVLSTPTSGLLTLRNFKCKSWGFKCQAQTCSGVDTPLLVHDFTQGFKNIV